MKSTKEPGAALPLELVYADGHLTDVGVAALADGEDAIVPDEACAHAETCEACAAALGREALHSMALGEALRVPAAFAPERISQASRAPGVPLVSLALGAAVSMLGVLLGSIGSPLSFGDRFRDARGFATAIAHAARATLRADFPPAVTFASTALLVCVALLVMRASPIIAGREGDRPLPS
jgi:hypothetical protein